MFVIIYSSTCIFNRFKGPWSCCVSIITQCIFKRYFALKCKHTNTLSDAVKVETGVKLCSLPMICCTVNRTTVEVQMFILVHDCCCNTMISVVVTAHEVVYLS